MARQHWMDNIPLGRVQAPREVGNVVLFLASEQSSYVTGANIFTDGGMTIQLTNRERFASKSLEGDGAAGAEVSFRREANSFERCFLSLKLATNEQLRRR